LRPLSPPAFFLKHASPPPPPSQSSFPLFNGREVIFPPLGLSSFPSWVQFLPGASSLLVDWTHLPFFLLFVSGFLRASVFRKPDPPFLFFPLRSSGAVFFFFFGRTSLCPFFPFLPLASGPLGRNSPCQQDERNFSFFLLLKALLMTTPFQFETWRGGPPPVFFFTRFCWEAFINLSHTFISDRNETRILQSFPFLEE